MHPSESRSPWKAGGGIPPEPEGLGAKGTSDVHPGARAGEDGGPSSISEAESKRGKFPFLFLFTLFRPTVDGRAASLTESTDDYSDANPPTRSTLTDPQKSCSTQAPCGPLQLTRKITHHSLRASAGV